MLNNESNNPMDVFCYMMVEEFLMRKGLDSTLNAYRKEWRRPDDETSVFSWYDVCMKLRLPDILESAPEKSTVLENLALTLTKEASLLRLPNTKFDCELI